MILRLSMVLSLLWIFAETKKKLPAPLPLISTATTTEEPEDPDSDWNQLILDGKEEQYYEEWAQWSPWSDCSRTCGSGIHRQYRRCLGRRCSGRDTKEKLCNTDPCPAGAPSFRAVQCANLKTANGFWVPVVSKKDSCQLTCRAQHETKIPSNEQQMTAIDGTECQIEGSNRSICLDGKCQHVGCDDIVGSTTSFDQCGICGGKGDTCGQVLFRWQDTEQFSPCDRTCGDNSYRVSVSVCTNTVTGRIVPERLCADQQRPRPVVQKCDYVICPAEPEIIYKDVWITGDWSDCSLSCGGGLQTRSVFCVETQTDPTGNRIENRKVPDPYCWHSKRPVTERRCNGDSCAVWLSAEWSQCSVTCGRGIRTRKVECQQNEERTDDYACPIDEKPMGKQPCDTGTECPMVEMDNSVNPPPMPSNAIDHFRFLAQSPWNADAASYQIAQEDELPNAFDAPPQGNPNGPRFFPSIWGECSVTCGSGVSTRSVECVAFQGITSSVIRLPDYECEGQHRPIAFQPCQLKACPQSEPANEPGGDVAEAPGQAVRGFRWEYGDWGPCSASCLGGRQKSSLKCVDVERKASVPWSYCDPKQRPIDLSRSCNNGPCPPSWETGPMTECSHKCGGGLRTRKVRCTRRVSRTGGAESTLILPDGQCPQPKPIDREPCGMADCPVQWTTGNWSECSRSCDAGEQRRQAVCERRTVGGRLERFDPPQQCAHLQKPPTVQLCNLGSCSGDRHKIPHMAPAESNEETRDFEQMEAEHRKLVLNIGGKATLYQGSSIKVKCPVRHFQKDRVLWTKNGQRIINDAHMKVSTNGALRIFHARMEDAGFYACHAGSTGGNVTLIFKPREEEDEITVIDNKTSQKNKPIPQPVEQEQNKLPEEDRKLIEKLRAHIKENGSRKIVDKLKTINRLGDINMEWAIGEWSTCSQKSCGKTDGIQVRQLKCRATVAKEATFVDEQFCEDFNVIRPPSSKSCMEKSCPHWNTSEWSECDASRCVRHSTALQRRDVRCEFTNGTRADFALCDRGSRPRVKKECVNLNCTAEWRLSDWGQCSRTCGDGGVQMRLLRCVWRGTRKAAGRNCQTASRPPAIRSCTAVAGLLPTCPSPGALTAAGDAPQFKGASSSMNNIDFEQCYDQSRFCDILKLFHTCDGEDIRRRCCFTCQFSLVRDGGGRRSHYFG